MLGTNITSVGWPNCGEIDILENIGREPTLVHGTALTESSWNPIETISGDGTTQSVSYPVSAPRLEAQAAEELRTAAAVRGLTFEQAQRRTPVRLRGVVTFFDETLYSRFIQDETAGIYLRESTNTPPLQPGQLVEVEGASSPGEYAPIVEPTLVRVVGEARLPVPKPVTYEQLAGGKENSQFVEIAGIVRWVHLDEGSQHHLIEIATGGGRISVTSSEEKSRYLDELTETARRMVTSLDEIVWAVNPRNDTIASLASYVDVFTNFAGQDVTFEGTVISNSIPLADLGGLPTVTPTSSWHVVAFIKEFTAGYGFIGITTSDNLSPGAFSVTRSIGPSSACQYGFYTLGPNTAPGSPN